jgi:N-acetyl sugar amidotransferase
MSLIICKTCVMDNSDPDISFDANGNCNHCTGYFKSHSKLWFKGPEGKIKLMNQISQIKANGEGKPYDCILGLSGGIDSAYLALLAHKWGLRPLAVHVDAGWNTEIAVKNIENLCLKLNIDLITEVIDWNAMRELQYAFFKSQVVNQDIPQDHAFFAALYKYASKNRIKYVLNGYNIASESIMAGAWRGHKAIDLKYLKSIFNSYKRVKNLKNYPLVSEFKIRFWYGFILKMKIVTPLNFMNYKKDIALEELKREVGFVDYGGKHNESRFTRFHQSYFLPIKYGFEKRKAHLSSLVVSEQISREEALKELEKPLYKSEVEKNNDIEYFIKKIGISRYDFELIMAGPKGDESKYSNDHGFDLWFEKVISILRNT